MTITADYLFIGLILIAAFLTYLARYTAQILVRMAASLAWLAMGIWLLLGNVTGLGMSDNWAKVLGFVFIIMCIVPFTWQARTDIERTTTVQKKGFPGAETASYKDWGPTPKRRKETSEDRQIAYREQLHSRIEQATARGRRRRRW